MGHQALVAACGLVIGVGSLVALAQPGVGGGGGGKGAGSPAPAGVTKSNAAGAGNSSESASGVSGPLGSQGYAKPV
ncbi:MAG: hypothetical protein ACKOHG_06050, partial [Planctomycetia bacterium]